ncbi:MAG TPA: 4'-phosphopantetheinyl transferase superfamily protein [Methanocorpusculum sp.]|nr:4'-phosphopantetheinyl transferase superfamily protein [Methanocorpusculum sp.]
MTEDEFPIRLYAADISVFSDTKLYAKAYASVSDERKAKTDRYLFPEGKYQSLGVELLLRLGLLDLGIDTGNLMFEYGAMKKPSLANHPEILYNQSHSGKYAICAISKSAVGCDVEKMSNCDLAIARRFFFAGEYDSILARKTPEEQKKQFFRLWTMKESFMKSTGLGLSLGLDSFEIFPDGDVISIRQTADDNQWFFKEYSFDEEYACSVCALQNCFENEVRMVSFKDDIERLMK